MGGGANFPSHLGTECFRLRKTPLKDFTPENFRILIGQQVSLHYLIPLALDLLEDNPLISGDLYEGDLLVQVARVDKKFWQKNPGLNNRVVEVKHQVEGYLDTLKETVIPALNEYEYLTEESG